MKTDKSTTHFKIMIQLLRKIYIKDIVCNKMYHFESKKDTPPFFNNKN